MTSTKKRKSSKAGGRTHLSLLVPTELKEQIESEAKRRGHSMVFEAAHRLEWSFQKQSLLMEVLTLWLGDGLAANTLINIGNDMLEVRAAELLERHPNPASLSAEERLARSKEALALKYEKMAERIRK